MEISEQLARQLLESIENGFINETTIAKFRYWHLDAVMNMTEKPFGKLNPIWNR